MTNIKPNLPLLLSTILLLATANSFASCLKEVSTFAQDICGEIDKRGIRVLVDKQGKLNAEVSGLVKKVLGQGGASLEGVALTDVYENVLREDLAKELFKLRDCRQTMAKEAIAQVCQKPLDEKNPSNTRVEQHTSGNNNTTIGVIHGDVNLGQPKEVSQNNHSIAEKMKDLPDRVFTSVDPSEKTAKGDSDEASESEVVHGFLSLGEIEEGD